MNSDYPPKELKNLFRVLKVKNFGINYDSGNSASLNYNLEEEFTHFGKFIKNIHLKDRLKKFSYNQILVKGTLILKNYLKILRKLTTKVT